MEEASMKANLFSANKPQRRSTRRVLIGSLVALTSLFAACGGDTKDSSSSSVTEAPMSTEVVGDAPQRIVSLSPTHTEILFAVGAGDQVVAVDSMSNYPAESAAVLTDILSAPLSNNTRTSSTEEMPPPTVNGILMRCAILSTRAANVFLFSFVAVMSRKTSSSGLLVDELVLMVDIGGPFS
jgi:hypothetical protein